MHFQTNHVIFVHSCDTCKVPATGTPRIFIIFPLSQVARAMLLEEPSTVSSVESYVMQVLVQLDLDGCILVRHRPGHPCSEVLERVIPTACRCRGPGHSQSAASSVSTKAS